MALSLYKFIFIWTSLTIVSCIFYTPLYFTNPTFKLIMIKTILANTFLISQTSRRNWFTCSFCCQIESTLAGNTSIIIQNSTFFNITMLSIQSKWFITLFTGMKLCLKFTSKYTIMSTLWQHQRIFRFTLSTLTCLIVKHTISDS